jgi:RES domain-containing protein
VRLWRISTFTDLSGEGGLLAPGRWHSRGHQIVYLADHPALALLETIVHLQVDAQDLPNDYKLLAIEVPDDLTIEMVDIRAMQEIG